MQATIGAALEGSLQRLTSSNRLKITGAGWIGRARCRSESDFTLPSRRSAKDDRSAFRDAERRSMHFALILIVILLNGCASNRGPVLSTTYYVAPNGSDSNAGTEAAPWKTLQKAIDTVNGGDVVYLRAGTYAAPTIRYLNPPADQWITFRPYQGEKSTINTSLAASRQGSLMIIDSSYLIFEGLEITDVNYRHNLPPCDIKHGGGSGRRSPCPRPDGRVGIDLRASDEFSTKVHHLIFRNNDIHHNSRHGMMGGATDVQLLNNRIYNNGHPAVGGDGYGTYISGARWVVRCNEIHHNSGVNLRLANTSDSKYYAVNWIIEQNLLHDALGPFWHPSGRPVDGLNVALYGLDGGIFRNNIVYDGYGTGVWSRNVSRRPTLIYNNTIYNNGDYGLLLSGTSIAINNIIYKNAQRESNYELIVKDDSTARNNIVGGSSHLVLVRDAGKESDNFTNIDPQFLNPAGGDFHLQSGSPAIDNGLTLSEVPGDYAGGARPSGATYDIGAFEFDASPDDSKICPASPPHIDN